MVDKSFEYRVKRIFGVALMIALLMFALFPALWSVMLSFRSKSHVFEPMWTALTAFDLENYKSILDTDFPRALANSLITAGTSTALSLVLGIPCAFALSKSRSAHKFMASWMLLLLRMAPPVGFVVPLFLLYLNIGFIDTYFGLIVAYGTLTLPFVVWSMWISFNQIPNELIEAGFMDGAPLWKVLVLIAIPTAMPGIVAAGVLGFLLAWNDFFFALVITRSDTLTAPVAIMNFISHDSVDWGSIAVAVIALTLPIIPIIIVANKYIVQSLGGAVKG